jgi:hypothetical protein
VFTDAKSRTCADDPAIGPTQDISLVLQATLDDQGFISGSLRGAEGEPRPFSGWLGLAAAITELAEPASGGSPQAAGRPAGLLRGGLEPPKN